MANLRATDLAALPERIGRPAYDRSRVKAGIVHFSVGNFHRAHQAVYVDRCLSLPGNEGWGICGVGLIDSPAERAKAEGMAVQDGLYTLTLFPPQGEPSAAVVGAMVEYLFAPADPAAVLARLRDPAIRIVSLTVTEGGYNHRRGDRRLSARCTGRGPRPRQPRRTPDRVRLHRRGLWRNVAPMACRPSPCCPATISSTMAR